MTTLKDIKKMREILKAIELGSAKFSTGYSFLEELERRARGEQEEDHQIEEAVAPIQKMLQNNRNSLLKLKENGESLMSTLRGSSGRSSEKAYSNAELDSEINYLTSVLKSRKLLR
jgi:transcriptional regulator NrdR family protein